LGPLVPAQDVADLLLSLVLGIELWGKLKADNEERVDRLFGFVLAAVRLLPTD